MREEHRKFGISREMLRDMKAIHGDDYIKEIKSILKKASKNNK